MEEVENTEADQENNGEANGSLETELVSSDEINKRHYQNKLSKKEFAKMCGYNFSKIPYPFHKSKQMQTTWLKRQMHIYDFPATFIPEYDDNNECEPHGNKYDDNDDNLQIENENIIVHNEIGEQTFDVKVMCRKTLGNCNCKQRYDGHPQLLWHLGKGKFVNYCMLVNYLHNFVNDGLSIHAQFKSIQDNNESNGISSLLTYDDIHRAAIGFFRNLEFDEILAFSCPSHGIKPNWVTADRKNLGPAKKRCKDLNELDCHPDDEEVVA